MLKDSLSMRRGGASNDWLPSSSGGHMDSVHLWRVGAAARAALGLAWHRRSAVCGLCGHQQAVSAAPVGQPARPHVQHGLCTVVAGELLTIMDRADTLSLTMNMLQGLHIHAVTGESMQTHCMVMP